MSESAKPKQQSVPKAAQGETFGMWVNRGVRTLIAPILGAGALYQAFLASKAGIDWAFYRGTINGAKIATEVIQAGKAAKGTLDNAIVASTGVVEGYQQTVYTGAGFAIGLGVAAFGVNSMRKQLYPKTPTQPVEVQTAAVPTTPES